jgi:ribosomal protein L20A (L18A)
MPESEMFKTVMQGGMLAMWAVFGWWVLTRGVPMLKEEVNKMSSSHQEMVKQISTENRMNILDLNTAHKDAVKVLSDTHREAVGVLDRTHREVVANLQRECREERKEIMDLLYSKIGTPEQNIQRTGVA